MSILLTGGTGKTSLRIASLLSSSNPPTPYILASRSGTSPPSLSNAQSCTFNWHDQSTWANSWTIAGEHGIKAVYLVAAGLLEPLEVLKPFIEFARRKGTKRFVLLSSSAIEEGGPVMGKVHGYLRGLEGEGVEWCVVRPAWFMGMFFFLMYHLFLCFRFLHSFLYGACVKIERAGWTTDERSIENLSEMHHLPTIRDESKLYSATGEGKLGWVSAEDIGAVAYRGLVDEKSHDCDHVVVGNEMLGYGDVSARSPLGIPNSKLLRLHLVPMLMA